MSEETNIYPFKRRTSFKRNDNKLGFSGNQANLKSFWKQELKQILDARILFLALIGFLMGRGIIVDELLPFGPAFLAAYTSLKKRGSIIIGLAITLGLLTITKYFTFLASVTDLVVILVFLLFLKLEAKQKWFAVPLLVFSLTVIVKTTFVALSEPSFYNYVVVLFEASIGALLSVVFLVAMIPLESKDLRFFKTNEEVICSFILIASVIVGLGDIEMGLFSIKSILSRFLIMLAALMGGASMGAVAGTMVGLIPSVGSLIAPTSIGLYAFTGMMAGVFKRFGKLGIGLGFMLGNILLSIYFTSSDNLMASLGETLFAVAIFLVFPSRFVSEIKVGFKGLFDQKEQKDLKASSYTVEKVKQLSKIFGELSRTFQQITCETEVQEDKGLKVFIEGVTSKLCNKCSRERHCWEQGELYRTYKGFLEAFNLLEQQGWLKANHVSEDLNKKCTRVPELAMALSSTYETYKVNSYWQSKVFESREIVSDQLKGVAVVMDNLVEELELDHIEQSTSEETRPLFQISVGVSKVGKGGSVVSGDNYSTMDLKGNKWAVVLSDGMGVGPKAAMESKAAISLLKQLMKAGISKDIAVKTVNSVLLLRSTEESFATLDLAIIDLNSAETDFLKIGAVPSFIKSENKVSTIKSTSLPVGILNHVHMESIKRTLQPGDILVMVTDGVLESRQDIIDRDEWLVEFLENLLIDEPQDIADLVLWHAKNNNGGRIMDDMTVLVIKIEVTDAF